MLLKMQFSIRIWNSVCPNILIDLIVFYQKYQGVQPTDMQKRMQLIMHNHKKKERDWVTEIINEKTILFLRTPEPTSVARVITFNKTSVKDSQIFLYFNLDEAGVITAQKWVSYFQGTPISSGKSNISRAWWVSYIRCNYRSKQRCSSTNLEIS